MTGADPFFILCNLPNPFIKVTKVTMDTVETAQTAENIPTPPAPGNAAEATPTANSAHSANASAAPATGRHPARAPLWLLLLCAVLLVLLGGQWLDTRSRIGDLQEELARRLASSDASTNENSILTRQNQEVVQTLVAKTGALEARLTEMQTQQLALDSMYQELSSSLDERLLAEIEQAVSIAAQQLQIAGNVEAALIALETADARLARSASSQLLSLRRLISRDVERLKALPLADIQGISMKLEGAIGIVDDLPLAFEQRARAAPVVKQRLGVEPPTWWQTLGGELWDELKQLVRIERVEQSADAETALLSPSQVFFLRENLKLRLITARLALLQRDGLSYREDLRQSRLWLERYFDTREKSVSSVVGLLKSLSAADLSLELPTLNETLGSIRSLKLARDKGK
ncbi:MAG: uroporphyrinogen-III C-methyltransferase [Sterolibacterium sp.]|nr:uroporphyrinogen-III C-methyltransferase [Sterolibacterium sp.]